MWFGEGPIMTADGIIQLPDYDMDDNNYDIAIDETHSVDDDDGEDALVIAPPRPGQQHNNTVKDKNDNDLDNDQQQEQERNSMLERLDRLLIIPPEYEYPDDDNDQAEDVYEGNHRNSHQFDDADSDDSDNDLL